MKIESGKRYRVERISTYANDDADYGVLPGDDVKRILKGYTYDEQFGLWYSGSCKVGYSVEEVQ